MWTERERILCNKYDIEKYLKSVDYFHDYKLGNVQFNKSANLITIEEDKNSISNQGAHIWDFTFELVLKLEIEMDSMLTPYIYEVKIDDNKILFELTNGYILVGASEIKLGIPTQ
ncbi:MAG: hypothetical protein NC412_01910 [Roseburia sp.]|nr:hypothetical protein [Roseburia sp.]MCM1278013.1 hypothetical protein [Robinsoniella sp.]